MANQPVSVSEGRVNVDMVAGAVELASEVATSIANGLVEVFTPGPIGGGILRGSRTNLGVYDR